MNNILTIEPSSSSTYKNAEGYDCETVWGYVFQNNIPYCVYYCHWHHPLYKESIDDVVIALSIGEWYEESDPSNRICIGVSARNLGTGIEFRIIDANNTPWSSEETLGQMLNRESVFEKNVHYLAYQILDAMFEFDPRLRHLL